MKLFSLMILAFFSLNAEASYLEHCRFQTELKNFTHVGTLGESITSETPLSMVVEVKSTEDLGSHIGCDHHLGKYHVVELNSEQYESLRAAKEITLEYFYANSLTPRGVEEVTRWNLVQ